MSRNPAGVVPGADPGVQQRLYQAKRVARGLHQPADERGPQRRYRAGSADHLWLPVDQDPVARLRVGVARDVGHARPGWPFPADRAPRPCACHDGQTRRRRSPRRRSPRRPARRSTRSPRDVAGGRVDPQAACHRRRARAGWTRGSRRGPSRRSPGRRCRCRPRPRHGDAERGGVGERLVAARCGPGRPVVLALAPADADRGGVGLACTAVVDRVDEAGVGVGREVDDLARRRVPPRRRPRCRAALRRPRRSGPVRRTFVAPSTPTAVTDGAVIPRPREVRVEVARAKPPPSSMMAMVCPDPSVPAGNLYACATWTGE